ncbi:MAG TPA: TolC family protein [Gemmatimonadales bacterium]|nr:TolC family protein [Gemmatimonadales bacterium]
MRRSLFLAAALVLPASLAAQTPAPVRLTFGDAVSRAAGTAPAVRLAALRVDSASARVRETRATLLPNLSLGGSWVNRTFNSQTFGFKFPGPVVIPQLIGPFNVYDARFTVRQTLFDFSAYSRVKAAQSGTEAVAAAGTVTSETAAEAAALAYVRALRAEATVSARRADSALAVELVGLAKAQNKAGVSAAIDVTRAQTQLVSAEGGLIVARNQADRGRMDLARALGLPASTPIELADTLGSAIGQAEVPATEDSAVAVALSRRPDLAATTAAGEAARRVRSSFSAQRLPSVGLEADYGSSGITVPGSIPTRQIALEVSLPILDGFRREGEIAEADVAVRSSAVRAEDLRQQIAADVAGAFLDLRSAEAQVAIAAERLQLAADELSEARQRFTAGVAGNIEVIDAQSSLIQARDAVIDARASVLLARVTLARAVGVARTLH